MFSQVFVILSPNGGGGGRHSGTWSECLPPPPPSGTRWDLVRMSTPPPPDQVGLGQNIYPLPPWDQVGLGQNVYPLPPPIPPPPRDQVGLGQNVYPPPPGPGGTWSECLPPPPPQTTRRRAVRILLECILVNNCNQICRRRSDFTNRSCLNTDQIKGSMVEQQSTYTDDIDVSQPVTVQGVEEEVEQVPPNIAIPFKFKLNMRLISTVGLGFGLRFQTLVLHSIMPNMFPLHGLRRGFGSVSQMVTVPIVWMDLHPKARSLSLLHTFQSRDQSLNLN